MPGRKRDGEPLHLRSGGQDFCSLQQKEEAPRRLQQAVRAFDEGLAELRRGRPAQDPGSFCEYTAAIMRAAADLGEHRYVFDLYRRWEPYHVSWESKFLAGAACFNIGRYRRAAALWGSLGDLHRLFVGMQQVALLVERGVIPPFEMVRTSFGRTAGTNGGGGAKERGGGPAVHAGRRFPHGDSGLGAGRNGERRTVELRSVPVITEPDEELDEVVNRAVRLRDQGKGELEESLRIMEMLEEIHPDNPVLLFNLAALMLQMGETERAREYCEKIDPRGQGEEFRAKLEYLRSELARAEKVCSLARRACAGLRGGAAGGGG